MATQKLLSPFTVGWVGKTAKKAEEGFKQDVGVQVLLATDAAGEGDQPATSAFSSVNYDLPWNPNRLEQRFGRIHPIWTDRGLSSLEFGGSLKPARRCVARTLLEKLEAEQKALGGRVFDVLGKAIAGKELRELLIKAIQLPGSPRYKSTFKPKVISEKLDQERLRELLEERALARIRWMPSKVQKIREDMERAEARRLQPHFIAAFSSKPSNA
ncbi:MAG UNVERIFIED_CONTAM: hypothetical protein LVR29_19695 [Microcystis novacekii LVE1205-3]